MRATSHKAQKEKGEVFCLKPASTRGRNLDIKEGRGGEVIYLRDEGMEKDGKDFLEG